MRHLPTRSTRHRVVGALAAALLGAAGLGTPALAAGAPAAPAAPRPRPRPRPHSSTKGSP